MKKLLAIPLGIFLALAAFATTISSPGGGSGVNGVPNANYVATTGGGATCAGTPAIINYNTVLFGDTDSAVTTGAGWRFTVPAGEMILNGCVFAALVPPDFIDVRCSTSTGTVAVTVNSGMAIFISRIGP